jgi:hypothetical protein
VRDIAMSMFDPEDEETSKTPKNWQGSWVR